MKEEFVDAKGNTMEDYDRWGTPKDILKAINEPTPAQKKLATEINAQREATAAEDENNG